jgi:predicted nucleic acid-binding protein
MTSDVLLLDAGVWIATVDDKDCFRSAARELVVGSSASFAALDLTLYEIANVVGSTWRKHERAARLCRSVQHQCAMPLARIDFGLVESVIKVAARYELTSYDAAYVAVARRHGWHLVSTDVKDLVSKGLAVTPDAAV